jgi:hypothetical protein
MRLRNFVDYDNSWGTLNVAPYVRRGSSAVPGPAGILGMGLQAVIDQAAALLAPTL